MQRDRATHRVYSDFVEAATKGAQAIVDKKVSSLNPQEELSHHVYVYN
jgi:protein TIF31